MLPKRRFYAPVLQSRGNAFHVGEETPGKPPPPFGQHAPVQMAEDEAWHSVYEIRPGQVDKSLASNLVTKSLTAKKSSAYGGAHTLAVGELTKEELRSILSISKEGQDTAAASAAEPDDALLGSFAQRFNESFRLMQLDTVEAQALFIAHSLGETGGLAKFTEAAKDEYKWKYDDAASFGDDGKLDTSGLTRYDGNKKIKVGDKYAFLGRGTVQVTFKRGYMESIVTLDNRAAELEAEGSTADAQTLRDAAAAIRQDPRKAGLPEYAFLVSAAFYKSRQSEVYKGGKPVGLKEGWMDRVAHSGLGEKDFDVASDGKLGKALQPIGGSKINPDEADHVRVRAKLKFKYYEKALEVLRARLQRADAAAAAATP